MDIFVLDLLKSFKVDTFYLFSLNLKNANAIIKHF